MLPSICCFTSEWWWVITQSGHTEANIIKPQVNITLPTKINHAFLFTPLSSSGDSLINNVCVSLADSCPQDTSHWAEIGFWYSINHKRRESKDIHSVGGVGGKQASILQEQHLQDELVSKKLPQPQMTELWMGETFDHPDILSHRICSLFSRDRRCTPPLEDRRFNEWKQFDLEALRSLWLTAPPVLTMGLIGTLSTVGKWLGASAGLTFCNPHTITVLTGDREHGEGAGSGKDYTLRCRLLWQVCVVNSENTDIDFCSQLKYWR